MTYPNFVLPMFSMAVKLDMVNSNLNPKSTYCECGQSRADLASLHSSVHLLPPSAVSTPHSPHCNGLRHSIVQTFSKHLQHLSHEFKATYISPKLFRIAFPNYLSISHLIESAEDRSR